MMTWENFSRLIAMKSAMVPISPGNDFAISYDAVLSKTRVKVLIPLIKNDFRKRQTQDLSVIRKNRSIKNRKAPGFRLFMVFFMISQFIN